MCVGACVCLCGRRVLFGQCAEASKSEKTKSETTATKNEKDQLEVTEAPKVVEARVLVVIVTPQIPRSRRPKSLMPQD